MILSTTQKETRISIRVLSCALKEHKDSLFQIEVRFNNMMRKAINSLYGPFYALKQEIMCLSDEFNVRRREKSKFES